MFQVRFHGRGGQGVVTSAELLSLAAFAEGLHAQAFPMFGSERTGAPIQAFCRIADAPIRAHEPILQPDAVVIQDATLLHQVDLFNGLRPDGYVVLNSRRSADELGLAELDVRPDRVHAIDASALAREHLGRPLPGAALLAVLAALTFAVTLSSLESAIRARFGGALAEGNARAARAAWFAIVEPSRA